MGQSACGHQLDPQPKQDNTALYNDSQIGADEEGDNPSKDFLKNKFLQTEVVASWNILKEKSSNLEGLRNIFKSITNDGIKNAKNLKTPDDSNCNQKVKERTNTEITNTVGRQKFREKVNLEYQNIQIQVSSFIKIRTENIFDFYEFKQKIGEGTFGQVFRGIQKRSGQVRAIKGLKKQMMNNVSKMNFIAEIDLLKKLDHPNIIKLYDLFLFQGVYYVVTQLCEGGCVQNYFSKCRNQISQQKVRIIMKQLFSALNYLYNCSIVHRDLKLQNLVFLKNPSIQGNENLEIKLIDFGTAVTVQKHKKNQTGLVGTLYYIAPQFIKGFFTQKCDIWSAGIIFFQLLFGEYPFRGKCQSQILHQISTKAIDWRRLLRKKVSKQAFQLVQNMLDKNYLSRASAKTLIQNEWIRGASVARASKQLQQSVSSSLAKYNRKNNFVSLIESFLAFKKVSQLERQQLSRMFCQIDIDNSGIIEIDELITFYKSHINQYNQDDIKTIVANVDKNNSGKIDFNEFLTAVAKKNQIFAQGALREAFQYVDKDRTGFITRKQLKELLKTADKRETDEVFMNLDENGDNQISFEEFKSYLINYE